MQISQQHSSKPAFGMAFEKPNKEVLGYFREVVSRLTQQNRDTFVKDFSSIVNRAKSCPVNIEHSLCSINGSTVRYKPLVQGEPMLDLPPNTSAPQIILKRMQHAVERAEDIHNINQNMKKIENCFDLKI